MFLGQGRMFFKLLRILLFNKNKQVKIKCHLFPQAVAEAQKHGRVGG